MFFQFFEELRAAKVPVTLKEYLSLMDALSHDVIDLKVDDFYYLSRAALVKDERNLDRFDRVFAHAFKGLETLDPTETAKLPEEWLRALTEKFLTKEEKELIESLGGWEKLMETLKKRLEEQKKRHAGGSKMIGTAGTSPFGAMGYNPEGVRIGQDKGRHGRAVKVWDRREYKNLDDSVELPGGSVEHWNEEAGAVWLDRFAQVYAHVVWLNPLPENHWEYTPSIALVRQLLSGRMYPLTLAGPDSAMRELGR